MYRLELIDTEVAATQSLLNEIARKHRTVEDTEFLHSASLYAHELPRRVCRFLNDFRLLEPAGVCIISGYPIDQSKIGRTPAHWEEKAEVSPALHEEILLVLYGALLGDVFGWSTQQAGYIVNDLLPIRGHEQEQLGSGSEQKLWWHTEDAFHPYRGDYIGLMCLRNPDKVATTIASIDAVRLSEEHVKLLFEPHYTIRPDKAHLAENKSDVAQRTEEAEGLLDSAYERVRQMNDTPQKVAVFFGDPRSPYIRLDPYFMDLERIDAEPQQALQALTDSIDASLAGVVLQPGDTCFIDNYRAVHGRNPFRPRYDGNDRWLKRINVTRDLRKSRSMRPSGVSRLLY